MTLAETAVELRLAIDETELREAAFAMELDALAAGATRARLEHLAARIGLSADATGAVLDHWQRRARAMRTAHEVIMGLLERGGIAT